MENIKLYLNEAGMQNCEDSETEYDFIVVNHYNNNYGYIYCKNEREEFVLLKGIYKDYLRNIKGKTPESNQIAVLSRCISDFEKSCKTDIEIKVKLDKDTYKLVSVEKTEKKERPHDLRTMELFRKLSGIEYSMSSDGSMSENTLISRSVFNTVMPETMSPLAASIAKELENIINPLFMSANFRTLYPSFKCAYAKPFINLNNIEGIFNAMGTTLDFFNLNYSPRLYLKKGKDKFTVPKVEMLKVSDEEIKESLADIRQEAEELDMAQVMEEDFYQFIGLIVMTTQMIMMRLWQSFIIFKNIGGFSVEETLQHIYKSRDLKIFEIIENPVIYFDPSSDIVQTEKKTYKKENTPEEVFASFSKLKRMKLNKSKFLNELEKVHKYLDMRDELTRNCDFAIKKIKEMFLNIGEMLVKKEYLKKPENVFDLEKEDVRKLLDDEFAAAVAMSSAFRKNQNERFKTLVMPKEIYEKDIENIHGLALKTEEFYEKNEKEECLSFNKSELSLKTAYLDKKDLNINEDEILVSRSLPFALCQKIEKCGAVLLENCSLFSHAMEIAIKLDKPIYIGVRNSVYYRETEKISLSENCVKRGE